MLNASLNSLFPSQPSRTRRPRNGSARGEGRNKGIINNSLSSMYLHLSEDEFIPEPSSKRCIFSEDARERIPHDTHLPIDTHPETDPQIGACPNSPAASPQPQDVVVLKHCRCIDCLKFSRESNGDYFCSEYIGGTSVVWATGRRFCDPPPDAWHYCACYDGPQVSTDVWLWPRTSRHVGPRSTISAEAEQPGKDGVGP